MRWIPLGLQRSGYPAPDKGKGGGTLQSPNAWASGTFMNRSARTTPSCSRTQLLGVASAFVLVTSAAAIGCGDDEPAAPGAGTSSGGGTTATSSGGTTSGGTSSGGTSSGGSSGRASSSSGGGSSSGASSSSGDAAVSSSGGALAACGYSEIELAMKYSEIADRKPCDATCSSATQCCADLSGFTGGIGGSGGIPGLDAGFAIPTEVCLSND